MMDKKRIIASAERIAASINGMEYNLRDLRLDWNAILEEFAEHEDSPVATSTMDRLLHPPVVVWAECNTPEYLPELKRGIEAWKRRTDTFIVTTRTNYHGLYRELADLGVNIIPGCKISSYPNDGMGQFWGPRRWRDIGLFALHAHDVTGSPWFVLEGEGAFQGFVLRHQHEEFQPGDLRASLQSLPEDLNYIVYPSIYGENDEQRLRSITLTKEFLNDRFRRYWLFSMHLGRTNSPFVHQSKLNWSVTENFIGNRSAFVLIYNDKNPNRWPDDKVVDAISLMRRQDVPVLYPGQDRFVAAAERTVLSDELIAEDERREQGD